MKTTPNHFWMVLPALMLLMALTRFDHFGSALMLPDASLAVFFLGGLYLARSPLALPAFAVLLIEAGLVDYYAIAVRGVSDWCVTPAYGFLMVVYAVMWFAGRGFAPRFTLSRKGMFGLFAVAGLSGAIAFVLSNASFYLFAGRFGEMAMLDYVSRVSAYFGSYVLAALFYVACAATVHLLINQFGHARDNVHTA